MSSHVVYGDSWGSRGDRMNGVDYSSAWFPSHTYMEAIPLDETANHNSPPSDCFTSLCFWLGAEGDPE